MTTNDISRWREEIRKERTPHHGINAYKCPECGRLTVTIDVDPGVTPMFLGCRRTEGCEGVAVSSGYPNSEPPPHILAHLEWEWAIPVPGPLGFSPEMRRHAEQGGLELVPRTGRPSAYMKGDD